MSMKIEFSAVTQAEKTDLPADPDIKSTDTNDQGLTIMDTCSSNGQIRKITVNGVCYSQMCCGGQWQFFYKDTSNGPIWCTCNRNESWTVSCSGANWILNCR